MDKKTKIYLGLFVLLILSMLYVESVKDKPVNWFPTYTAKHKLPYGTFVLKEQLPSLFSNSEITSITEPPYLFLKQKEESNKTYVFINNQISFGDAEIAELMKFVESGNDVFISSHSINIDTLNIETALLDTDNFEQKSIFKFKNKVFKNKEYTFDRFFSNTVFDEFDAENTTVLGITAFLDKNDNRTDQGINFIKFKHGDGNFYLHTFPEVFTNYNILKGNNHQHAANVLSYLDTEKDILWDAYYKTGKSKITSPLHYLLSSKQLKWAYYMALIGVLFFIVFNGKRTQRIIPIITPLKNQTLAFTRTISNMYFEKSEHKNIAEHKINYLLEFIRTKLHIPTTQIDDTFYNYVAQRSGYDYDKVVQLFKFCDEIHMRNQISENDLVKLNRMIENFKNTIQYGK
ncbi:protein of unknown function [Lutibacter oricola]|uniref:DUF4350 domain-containing protein n=1 Tax=Lutibacter oricola TaxID=762486 RepID=A0A1H3F5E9_9FLAO|nr:DUF4350 domain-containing protein [Lutibacter oricola]SDX86222.1 protein of unknown function [Lutibacter oricola]